MMATLVVGPFYLSGGLLLDAPLVGLTMSVDPLVVALGGVPAGRFADRYGPPRMVDVGRAGMAVGCPALSVLPGPSPSRTSWAL